MKTIIGQDEVQALKKYFIAQYGSSEISRHNFNELINHDFKSPCDSTLAANTLFQINSKLRGQGDTATTLLKPFNVDKDGGISLRNFKCAMNSLQAASRHEIDNVCRYLDSDNDGFIYISEFESALKVRTIIKSREWELRKSNLQEKEYGLIEPSLTFDNSFSHMINN